MNTFWVLMVLRLAAAKMDPGSYAPKTNQQCPQTLLRQSPALNQTLNPNEAAYEAERRKSFPDAWREWVGDGSNLGYDLDKLGITANNGSGLPVIAIAASGGGYRASQNGAGVVSALDARNRTAKAKGTGGLLQVTSYLSGIGGGSWLVASMLFHDFPDMYDLVLGNIDKGGGLNGWFLNKSLVLPYGNHLHSKKNQHFWGSLLWSVNDKGRTGLDTSLTDIWSRALSYHFLTGLDAAHTLDTITTDTNFFTNDTSHGAGILWSDMKTVPTFQKREFPLPIIVANGRPPGFSKSPVPFLKSTQYEFTLWEMGSYDPDLSAFINVQFLGTRLISGQPLNASACVTEFDQTSFIFGTSSSSFNQLIDAAENKLLAFDSNDSIALLELLRRMLEAVTTRADDVANYPNPFQGINPGIFQDANSEWIELIDGSMNKENIPIGPLLVKARHVDFIVAIDAGAEDPHDWPIGRSIFASRNRTREVTTAVVQKFPPVPDKLSDIDHLGLNRRPTFFGCDPKENPAEYPLMVYIPNAPPADGSAPVTNSGTFKLQYSPIHTLKFLDQAQATAFNGFMEGQLGADPDYGTCFQCAAIDRARLKTNPVTPRSGICSSCFKKYCYDPENPPPEGQIVGRRFKFKFKNPDPFDPKTDQRLTIILFFVVLVLLASFTGCVIFWRKRAAYQRLSRGEGSEWSVDMGRQSYEMETSRYSPPSCETANGHYSEPSDPMLEPHFTEPSHEGVEVHYAGPSDETVIGAESSNETANPQYAPPSHPPPHPHDAELSHEATKPHYSEPSY